MISTSTTPPSSPILQAALERCTYFYLQSASIKSQSDELIHTAFEAVTSEICGRLFEIRDLLHTEEPGDTLEQSAVAILRALIDWLRWARFKRCPGCGVDEVCMIPMWPFGSVEDYDSPRCINSTERDSKDRLLGPRRRPYPIQDKVPNEHVADGMDEL